MVILDQKTWKHQVEFCDRSDIMHLDLEEEAKQNGWQFVLCPAIAGFENPGSPTYYLCDSGQVTWGLCALVPC